MEKQKISAALTAQLVASQVLVQGETIVWEQRAATGAAGTLQMARQAPLPTGVVSIDATVWDADGGQVNFHLVSS